MAIAHDLTFHTAPGTTDGADTGRDSTQKLGFYGTTPIARPDIGASPDAASIAAALVALGLVTNTG